MDNELSNSYIGNNIMATTLTCNQGNRVSAEPCISQMTECPFLRYSTEHQFLMHPLKHPIKIQVSLYITVQKCLGLKSSRSFRDFILLFQVHSCTCTQFQFNSFHLMTVTTNNNYKVTRRCLKAFTRDVLV